MKKDYSLLFLGTVVLLGLIFIGGHEEPETENNPDGTTTTDEYAPMPMPLPGVPGATILV